MKKVIGILLMVCVVFIMAMTVSSCTKNQRAKSWGGDSTLELPANQKLVVVTWKDNDLWYLTKPMTADDVAETYTFTEKSDWGILEGTYTLKEVKK